MQNKAPGVYAQICVYERKSLLPAFLRCLTALCGEEGDWSLSGISAAGTKRIPKAKGLRNVFDKIPSLFPEGFNQFEIAGKGVKKLQQKGVSEILIGCGLSPLNKDWAKVGEIDSKKYTRPIRRTLMGIKSSENFVFGNEIKRHPVALGIQFWFEDENISLSRKTLLSLFKEMIQTWSEEYTKGYICYIDAQPIPTTSARSTLGGNSKKASRMDVTFDEPHMMIVGSDKVLDDYVRDVLAEYPKINVTLEKIGSATVVAFKDRKEISEIYLPKWHDCHP